MIIAAYAGTGKTTLAKECPERFRDFVCMPYKYELNELPGDETEAEKANPDNVLRMEWPFNYVDAIKAEMREGKHLLIPTDYYVMMMLRVKNMPYVVCYPERSAKDEYLRRYLQRGNTVEFTDIFIGRWDKFLDGFESDRYGRHIILKPGEFLSDVI
jgi:hypothetical protein